MRPGRMRTVLERGWALALDGLLSLPMAAVVAVVLLLPGIPIGYWAALLAGFTLTVLVEARLGRTLGKALAGVRVVDVDGRPARGLAMFWSRWGARLLLLGLAIAVAPLRPAVALALLVDHGWALFDPAGRTLHDHWAGTRVIDDGTSAVVDTPIERWAQQMPSPVEQRRWDERDHS